MEIIYYNAEDAVSIVSAAMRYGLSKGKLVAAKGSFRVPMLQVFSQNKGLSQMFSISNPIVITLANPLMDVEKFNCLSTAIISEFGNLTIGNVGKLGNMLKNRDYPVQALIDKGKSLPSINPSTDRELYVSDLSKVRDALIEKGAEIDTKDEIIARLESQKLSLGSKLEAIEEDALKYLSTISSLKGEIRSQSLKVKSLENRYLSESRRVTELISEIKAKDRMILNLQQK